jgi:hypothetical protein
MNTNELKILCSKRFCAPEWAYIQEVGNTTGLNVRRHADGIAMNLWPSRGLAIHGLELKSSRSDWLRELKNPEKAEAIYQYCDYWWLVAPDDVANLEEIPEGWGWLAPKGKRLVVKKEAPVILKKSKEVSRSFLAALLRKHVEANAAEVHVAVEKELADTRKKTEDEIERRVRQRLSRYTKIQEDLDAIKALTGIDMVNGHLGRKEIAAELKLVHDSRIFSSYSGLVSLAADLQKQFQAVTDALDTALRPFNEIQDGIKTKAKELGVSNY